jgi:RsbT co-antagonist protein rsbRD N-terminal domain
MLAAQRLVRLIETHSDGLAASLLEKTRQSDKTRNYVDKVPPEDLRQRVHEIYQHLGQWLISKKESDVEKRYLEIGALRARQGVLLSQLIWAILLVKDNLFDFLNREAAIERPSEVFGELEIMELLDQFFERAVYYAAVGYERGRAA